MVIAYIKIEIKLVGLVDMNVIVTGANGFVGRHTVKHFLDNGCNVCAIARDRYSILGENDKLSYISADVSDIKLLEKKLNGKSDGYNIWIHFAWQGSSGCDRYNYELQIRNVISTVECLKYAAEIGCNRFICAGSIMEIETDTAIHKQGTKPGMAYIYGAAKSAAHSLCKIIASDVGIDLTWAMITNAYGAGEESPRFINSTLRKIINGRRLEFTAATQIYDFIHVSDVARAFYLISKKGKPFCEYVIGSGRPQQLRKYIIEMINSVDPSIEIRFGDIPYTGVEIRPDKFSIEELMTDCGFTPRVNFRDGIKETYLWLKENDIE